MIARLRAARLRRNGGDPGSESSTIGRPAGPVNPFELYLLAVCALQGWVVLTNIANPPSVQAVLPPILRILWGSLLLIGGVFSVSGLYWWHPFTGIEIKRVGLVAAAGGTLTYGIALIFLGPIGYVGAAYNLFFCTACIVRVGQVSRALTHARRRVKAMREPESQGR